MKQEASETVRVNDNTIPQAVQGLIENEGHLYSNWGLRRRTTKPAVYVEPISYRVVKASSGTV